MSNIFWNIFLNLLFQLVLCSYPHLPWPGYLPWTRGVRHWTKVPQLFMKYIWKLGWCLVLKAQQELRLQEHAGGWNHLLQSDSVNHRCYCIKTPNTIPEWNIFCYCSFFICIGLSGPITFPKWNILCYCRLLVCIGLLGWHTLPKWNILCYCSLFICIDLSRPQHPPKVKYSLLL